MTHPNRSIPPAFVLAQVVEALTRTVVDVADRDEVDPPQVTADVGQVVAHVLTGLAANVGGPDRLLHLAPTSWQAAAVRQIVHRAGGDDDVVLLAHRTRAIRLHIDPAATLPGMGLRALADRDVLDLRAQVDQVEQELVDLGLRVDQRARLEGLDAQYLHIDPRDPATADLRRAVWVERAQRRTQALAQGRQIAGSTAATLDALRATIARIDELWASDVALYRQAYAATARHLLARHGVTAAVQVVPDPRPAGRPFDEVLTLVEDDARERTPLPMTGLPPEHGAGGPAAVVLRAGRGYVARAMRP